MLCVYRNDMGGKLKSQTVTHFNKEFAANGADELVLEHVLHHVHAALLLLESLHLPAHKPVTS